MAIGWLAEVQSATIQYQQWFQLDIIYLAFCCYPDQKYFNQHLFRAGHYKIPAHRQALPLAAIEAQMKLVFLFLFFPLAIFAQHEERKVFLYNTVFGGITSAVGAIINKPSTKKLTSTFIKGFWQGTLGGMINYSSKRSVYFISKYQNVAYAVPAKLLNAAGNSIIENAALCEPFLQNWNIDYGPIRLDFSVNGKRKITARLLPESVYALVEGWKKTELDVTTTLLSGSFAFAYKKGYSYPSRGTNYLGLSFGRAFVYTGSQTDPVVYNTIAHEMVHQFQYREYQVFNSWIKRFEKKVKGTRVNKLFSSYVYLDIPYFFIAYGLEGSYPYQYRNKNFFEFEADRCAQ